MKYFLIAGEASGDLHASNLMKELKKQDPDAEFRFMGGDLMNEVSDGLVMHYRETSYMLLDVFFHLGKIFRNMRKIKTHLRNWEPDLFIPVDYAGFNLRIARYARGLHIRVFYYISPKVWAWQEHRVKKLKKYSERVFSILPFEVEYFKRFHMKAEYFGNPLVDEVSRFRRGFEGADAWKKIHKLGPKPLVALLAGSRKKEIESTLPSMVKVASEHPGYTFVVAGAPSIEPALYGQFLDGSDVKIVYGETYSLLEASFAGLITSGTATLEAALFDLPQAVLYRTGTWAYHIVKPLIKINFISLVNLIHGKQLVLEIIQKDLYGRSQKELSRILEDADYREGMKEGYKALRSELGEEGVSERIAKHMVELLKQNTE
ncbi:MAG: lipid-A-disaccharide synthase [Bacteroidota bacterium]